MLEGDWESLRILAEHGEKYCKEGIRRSCKRDAEGGFPSPSQLLKNRDSQSLKFAALILQMFAEAAGIEVEDTFRSSAIQFPSRDMHPDESIVGWLGEAKRVLQKANEGDSIPLNRHLAAPLRLPSKAKLREAVLAEWKRLTGARGKSLEKTFSRVLNTMGLGGLMNMARGVGAGMRSYRQKCIEDPD